MYHNLIFLINQYYEKKYKSIKLHNISLKQRQHLNIICIKKIPQGYIYFYNDGRLIIKNIY